MNKKKQQKTNWSNEAEFKRLSDEFYAALANLPEDWRDIAEGKTKLPETLDDARTQLGDAFTGVAAEAAPSLRH